MTMTSARELQRLAIAVVMAAATASCGHPPAGASDVLASGGDVAGDDDATGADVASDAEVGDAIAQDTVASDAAGPDAAGDADGDTGLASDAPLTPDGTLGPDTVVPCAPVGCDDANPCTTDTCDAAQGCLHAPGPDGGACDDGNACTSGDNCTAGKCVGADSCKPCKFGTDCDDGDACTVDSCSPAKLCAHAVKDCGDGNVCTTDSCIAGTCQHAPNALPCDDTDACTANDTCAAGTCKPGKAACDDGNSCTFDCDPKGDGSCLNSALPDATACTDGNACTTGDVCKNANCLAGAKQVVCDDGNPCTDDVCAPAVGCQVSNNAAFGGCCDGGSQKVWQTDVVIGAQAHARDVAGALDGGVWATVGWNKTFGPLPWQVIRTDAAGKVLWNQTYPLTSTKDAALRIFALGDGSARVVGAGLPTGQTQTDFVVAKLDAAGVMAWQVALDPGVVYYTGGEIATLDGKDHLILAGQAPIPPGKSTPPIWLGKVDAAGTVVEQQTFEVPGVLHVGPVNATAATATATLIVGSGDNDVVGELSHPLTWLHAIGANAVAAWDKMEVLQVDGDHYGEAHAAAATLDGGWVVIGQEQWTGPMHLWIWRLDASGNTVWEHHFGGEFAGDALQILTTDDGGFTLYDQTVGKLRHIAKDGTLAWNHLIVGANTGGVEAISLLPGGGLAAASDFMFSSKTNTVRLQRLDAWGNTTCGTAGICATKTLTDCDDGNPCTADVCASASSCSGEALPIPQCDDGDLCTLDTCVPKGGCTHTADASGCCVGGVPGVWDRTYGVSYSQILDVVPVPSGGAAWIGVRPQTTGDQPDLWFMRTDSAGLAVAQSTFPGMAKSGASSIDGNYGGIAAGNGGFALASKQDPNNVLLRRLDASGNVTWQAVQKQAGSSASSTTFIVSGVAADTGGGWLVSGAWPTGYSTRTGFILRYDDTGAQTWANYLANKNDNSAFTAVAATGDGGAIAAGANQIFSTNAIVRRVDASGVTVWQKSYGVEAAVTAPSDIAATASGFVIAGNTAPFGGTNSAWLLAIDGAGTQTWTHTWPSGYRNISGVGELGDGSLAVSGGGSGTNGSAAWVGVVNAFGSPVWERSFDGWALAEFNALAVTATGHLLLAGDSANGGIGQDAWLVQTDGWGNSTCAQAGACAMQPATQCDDGNPCTADACSSAGCSHSNVGDGTACGLSKTCSAGVCP
jgi:hypothetical protein